MLYEKTFPKDWDVTEDDNRYNMTPDEYSCNCANDHYVFAVKNRDRIRFLLAHLKYIKEDSYHDLSSPKIREVTVDVEALNRMIEGLKKVLVRV